MIEVRLKFEDDKGNGVAIHLPYPTLELAREDEEDRTRITLQWVAMGYTYLTEEVWDDERRRQEVERVLEESRLRRGMGR